MRKELTIHKENITNIKDLINDYGYKGLCYYFTLTEIIDNHDNILPIENLPEVSKDSGIDFNLLTKFTDDCISKYKMNGRALIISYGEYLSIPSDIKHVNLDDRDYDRICDKYGKRLTDTALPLKICYLWKNGWLFLIGTLMKRLRQSRR